MKKLNFIFLVLIIIFPFKSFSQNKQEWGLKVGLNYTVSKIQIPIPAEFKGQIGFYVGGTVSFVISDKVRINPELLFSSQATEYFLDIPLIVDPNDPFNYEGHKAEIKESLILLPIMLKYLISDSFDFDIGPQVGFLINQRVTDNSDQLEYGTANDNFEMGLNLGVGYRFALNYRIGTRFIYGIVDRDNVKNLGFQFGLHYNF